MHAGFPGYGRAPGAREPDEGNPEEPDAEPVVRPRGAKGGAAARPGHRASPRSRRASATKAPEDASPGATARRRRAALHEAAHVVMALAGRFSRLGRVLLPAGDVGCGESEGTTQFHGPSRLHPRDRYGAALERVRILLAGGAAERVRYGRWNPRAAGTDWGQAVAEARRLGLRDACEIDDFLRAQRRLVQAILSLPRWWAAVEAIAAELLERGTLSSRHARRIWDGAGRTNPTRTATARHGVPSGIQPRETGRRSTRGTSGARSGAEVDARVRPLVRAMARVPGLRPFSSCGGHADPEARGGGSVPAGQFFVSFSLPRTRRGWDALDRIAWAAQRVENVDVVPWHNSDPSAPYGAAAGSLDFEIRGRSGADPDDVADALHASGVRRRRARGARAAAETPRAGARRRR